MPLGDAAAHERKSHITHPATEGHPPTTSDPQRGASRAITFLLPGEGLGVPEDTVTIPIGHSAMGGGSSSEAPDVPPSEGYSDAPAGGKQSRAQTLLIPPTWQQQLQGYKCGYPSIQPDGYTTHGSVAIYGQYPAATLHQTEYQKPLASPLQFPTLHMPRHHYGAAAGIQLPVRYGNISSQPLYVAPHSYHGHEQYRGGVRDGQVPTLYSPLYPQAESYHFQNEGYSNGTWSYPPQAGQCREPRTTNDEC